MDDSTVSRQLQEIRTRVDELSDGLRQAHERIGALEARLAGGAAGPARVPAAPVEGAPVPAAGELLPGGPASPGPSGSLLPGGRTAIRVVTLVGRTLVVLAGAYLLRAFTEMPAVPDWAGVAAGMAYAAAWLFLADRSARAGQRLGAVFHGLASAVIAYPLLWELATRFQLLGDPLTVVALFAYFSGGMAVAWRRRLDSVAWVHALFAAVVLVALILRPQAVVPAVAALLLVAAAVEAFTADDRAPGLRWPVALLLDVVGLHLALVAARPENTPPGFPALPFGGFLAILLAIPLLYAVSIAARVLIRRRSVGVFDAVQAVLAVTLGLAGALEAGAVAGAPPVVAGSVALLLGAGGYAVAFFFVEPRPGSGRNFYAFSSFALALALAGLGILLGGMGLAMAELALASAAGWLSVRFRRMTLRFHAAVYLAAAAFGSGLMKAAADRLTGPAAGPWQGVSLAAGLAALVTAAGYAYRLAIRERAASAWAHRLPDAAGAVLLAWAVPGLAAGVFCRWLAGAPGAGADAAVVAAVRTVLGAALAVGLAWAGRRWEVPEFLWLAYPALAAGGVKLLAEDFPVGRPVTLVVALAFYGGTLILVPKLLRKETQREPEAGS